MDMVGGCAVVMVGWVVYPYSGMQGKGAKL